MHRISTQTVDSPHVFERLVLQKQPKTVNKVTKIWNNETIRDLEQDSPNRTTILSLDCCLQSHFFPNQSYSFRQSTSLYAQLLIKGSRKNRLNPSTNLITDTLTKHFTTQSWQLWRLRCPVTKTVLPCAPHSEVWSCLRIGNSSKSTFFTLL